MHGALRLIEISEVVCEFLDRRTLARLARTSRAFEEPALDALWKVIDGPDPLAKLLPRLKWIFEEDPVSGYWRHRLLQPPSLQQWKVIQKYTSRMTVISSCHFGMTNGFPTSNNRLQAIAVHWPPSEPLPPLFPKLKTIRGAEPTPENVALYYWLNGPSLTEFRMRHHHLRGDLASQTLIDFVSDMGTIYPNMKTFDLKINDEKCPETMIRALSKTIRSWKHLEHVVLRAVDLDTAAYEHLMRLESLTSLTLWLASDGIPHLKQAVLPRKPFPMLTDLTLDNWNCYAPLLVEWFNCFHLSPSSLSCKTVSFAGPQHITDLCHAIAARLCHKSLEMIILEDDYHTTSAKVDSIRPLFSFSRIRCVKLARLCTISLSDDDLLELATSWPLLQVMTLNDYINRRAQGGLGVMIPTFKGFFHLLQHCQHLRELAIVIDARKSEWVDTARPWDRVRHHPMDFLCLGNSFVDDAKRVASILSVTLPSLKEVDTTWPEIYEDLPEGETLLPLWKQVNHHLGELRKCTSGIGDLA